MCNSWIVISLLLMYGLRRDLVRDEAGDLKLEPDIGFDLQIR